MDERKAEGLIRGMGAENKMRFEAKTEEREEGESKKMLIRLIRKYEKTGRKQRGYTPTESNSESEMGHNGPVIEGAR